MKFTKMQGIGNDYVYVNCFKEKVEDPGEAAIKVSDRHFGIGSDGLILIKPSKVADFQMDMYNADGSRGAMWKRNSLCGEIRIRLRSDRQNICLCGDGKRHQVSGSDRGKRESGAGKS